MGAGIPGALLLQGSSDAMKLSRLPAVAVCGVLLAGCANDEPAESAFRAQTDALERTTQALDTHEAAAAAQRQAIDDQSR